MRCCNIDMYIIYIFCVAPRYFNNTGMTYRLPPLATPKASYMGDVIVDAFIAVIICYSVSLSLEKVFAKKHGYSIHPNQVCTYVPRYRNWCLHNYQIYHTLGNFQGTIFWDPSFWNFSQIVFWGCPTFLVKHLLPYKFFE